MCQPEGEDECPRPLQVRWADLEAAKEEQRKREIGFCIGSSWTKVSEEEAESILKGTVPSSHADSS